MIQRILNIIIFSVICIESHAYKLTSYIPQNNPCGIGVVICPGGSYFWLDKQTEGRDVAKWLNENGVTAFVLEYAHGGWGAFAFHVRFGNRSFPAGFNDLYSACLSLGKMRKNTRLIQTGLGVWDFLPAVIW